MTKNEDMVRDLTTNFQTKGLEIISAKCNGFTEPVEVQGVTPDVVGWDSEKEVYHLGIVADSEIISHDSTKEKMQVLAKMAMGVGPSQGKRLPFYVGVTKDANTIADKKLEEIDNISRENIEKILI